MKKFLTVFFISFLLECLSTNIKKVDNIGEESKIKDVEKITHQEKEFTFPVTIKIEKYDLSTRGNIQHEPKFEKKEKNNLNDQITNVLKEDKIEKFKKLLEKNLRINRLYMGKSLINLALDFKSKKILKFLLLNGAIIDKNLENSLVKIKDYLTEKDIESLENSYLKNILKGSIYFKDIRKEQKIIAEKVIEIDSHISPSDVSKDIINKILSGANINEFDSIEMKDKFMDNICSIDKEILEKLFERYELDINITDSDGNSLLYKAIEFGNIQVADELLNLSIDPNIYNEKLNRNISLKKAIDISLKNSPLVYSILIFNAHENIKFIERLIDKTDNCKILEKAIDVLKNNQFRESKHIKEINNLKQKIEDKIFTINEKDYLFY